MRYVSLFICVLAIAGCKSAEQQAADRARLAANVREFCVSLGYQAGSVEAARCGEEMVKKMSDEDTAGRQAGAAILAAQARNRVSCTGYGNTVNCY
jgi:uncharacterized protein YfiM (DUF2279 family)